MTPRQALVGTRAPDFSLPCTRMPDSGRQHVALSDYLGRWLILMFYPRDFSLVCPTELTALSARIEALRSRECDVLGATAAQILPSLLSAAAVARGDDSDRAGTVGAATPTERCGAQRTTPGIGVRVSRTLRAGPPALDAGRIPPGVAIREVLPGSPAEAAKLQADTMITRVNGQNVQTPADYYDAAAKAKDVLTLQVTKNEGGSEEVALKLR